MRQSALIVGLTSLLLVLTAGCLRTGPDVSTRHRQAVNLFSQGHEREREGQWREAITLYEQSLGVTPIPGAHFRLGLCHTRLGNLESAENHFARALELSPSYDLAQTHLLQIQARRAESPSAPPPPPVETAPEPEPVVVQDITPEPIPEPEPVVAITPAEEPIAEDPEPVEDEPEMAAPAEIPTVDDVRDLLFPGQHGDPNATPGSERLRQSNLETPDFHMGQAALFESQQDYVNALREYRLAFERDRTRVDAVLAAARVHARLGHDEESIECYDKAMEMAPSDPEVFFQVANHHFRRGEHDRARTFYEQSLDLNAHQKRALNNLGAALREMREFDEAIACLNQAVEIDPTYAPPHRNLGNIHAEQGRDREALEAYREYVRLGGSSAGEVTSWIRELELRLGDN